jgi:two-component system cell cycle response regulator
VAHPNHEVYVTDAPTRRPPLILLAGAEEWSNRSLDSVLSPHGYAILRCYTDRQTVELARASQPDAVIVDVGLPETGAVAVCRELRAGAVPPSTPVLVITPGVATRQQRLEALRAGASDLLGLPIDTEEMVLRLERLVAAKRDADRARAEGLTDESTGLYNAKGLEHRLRELQSLANRRHGPLACIVLSLDQPDLRRPAAVPDGGPRASELMTEALLATRRASDVIARLGTSEFAIVAPESDVEGARALAERLHGVLQKLATERGAPSPPAIRAGLDGVADFGESGLDPAEVLRRANAALQTTVPGDVNWLRRFMH